MGGFFIVLQLSRKSRLILKGRGRTAAFGHGFKEGYSKPSSNVPKGQNECSPVIHCRAKVFNGFLVA